MSPAHDSAGMRECLLSAAIVLLAAPRLWAGSATPFTLGEQGGIIVPVMIGGAGPFMMLLDTGATHSVVAEEVAARVAARTVAHANVISPTDTRIRRVVAVEQLSIGSVRVDLLLPSVVANGSFDRRAKIQGLIGQDVLAARRYTVDFKRRVIEWHTEAPPGSGTMLPLVFEHGRFLVQVKNDGAVLRLVPDSGAGGLVLFTSARVTTRGLVEAGTAELQSASATVPARQIVVRELRVGGKILRDVAGVAVDGRDRLPAEGDGLLPLHLFDRVTFDGPSRVLILG
jgi:predicted aspartyl protease